MTCPSSTRACASAAFLLITAVTAYIPLRASAQQDGASIAPGVPAASIDMVTTVASLEQIQAPPLPGRQLQVGDATHNLLALQRNGISASTTPRPLTGEIASLSYKRYLDSFKFPIPEKFGAAVQKSGSSSGGGR
ncbi:MULTISPECIES: DUF3613 domain-containing protein [unclassified Variovorax]|uniref:DUF3613 domain-containing protein n=1 Tax=unclassified Variovorax TaxID=663243 RepID=UPI002578A9E2|nr:MULTISPECIES: DUF3613 domain-containing protein [unclassified Variovorax]MDM0087709.1 DUF3613 domain-containing protein [Variovorax sp. J22G40]MDM0144034.1 DUF3613 domain-containing protein [Variovorax sp. J2P1-31]